MRSRGINLNLGINLIFVALTALTSTTAQPALAAAPLAFTEITATSGLEYTGSSWTVAWADANGDALPDLFFGNHGAMRNLFFNRGNGTFTEAATGVFNRIPSDAHGAVWADFDNDGDQDLIELVGADRGSAAAKSNHLYVNEGGVLNDQAAERGVVDSMGRGRTPLWFDWDSDGDLDLLALNADRADAPSILFQNVSGYFSRTSAIDFQGFTKYGVLGSLGNGRHHLVISGQPFPKRVHDANQVSPLPMTDLREALGIASNADMIADTVLFDVNGDAVDDMFEIKGQLTSDVAVIDGDIHARIVLENMGGTRGFRFSASEPIIVNVAPLWSSWWSTADVYIGRTGWHPASFPIQLSTTTSNVDGLATPVAAKGIYIGFDRSAGKWNVRVVSGARQEANFIVDGGLIGGVQPVGFVRFSRMTPTLLTSRDGSYVDGSIAAGLTTAAMASHCFSATAADFDNDADQDLFLACSGPVAKDGIENMLLANDGSGRFTVVPQAAGISRGEYGVADGAATADYDLDGFIDLALSNGQGPYPFNNGPSQVFHNTSRRAGNPNYWLEIDLRGVESNRDAIGALVVLRAGGRTQTRLQRGGVHNASQDFTRIHFGLGASTAVDSIEVRWPSGARQWLTNVPSDQLLRIVEGRSAGPPFQLQGTNPAYGNQTIYTTSVAHRFTVTNLTRYALPIVNIQLIGANAAQFGVARDCGKTLAAGASCRIDVAFKPTTAGTKSAQLLVVAGDKFVETASLTGSGVPAQLSLSPTSTAFGSIRVGAASASKYVTVRNAGASVLPVRSVTLQGVNPGQFSAVNRCPQYVAVGQTCTVSVTFKPTSKGSKSAQLAVSPGLSGAPQTAALTGTGA